MTVAETIDGTQTKGSLSLELTKWFDAAPERVFDAWLTDEWSKWLPPGGATGSMMKMDAVEGGDYAVSMTMPDNRQIEINGRYLVMDRPNKLVMTWIGNYDGRETILTVLLKPEGKGTKLTLRQEGFVEQGLQQGYIRGWEGEGGSFDKLGRLL